MKLILDRFEGNIAVLTDEECRVYEIGCEMLPLDAVEDDSFEADIRDGAVISVVRCENPDAGKTAGRLRSLFEKSKNK